jgi:hypothetical protein
MKKAILTVYAKVNKRIEEFGNVIREGEKKHLEEINRVTNEFCKTRIYFRDFLERTQSNTLQSVNSSELLEDELTASQTEHLVSLHSIIPINDSIQVIWNEYDPFESVNDKPSSTVRPFSVMTININPVSDFSSTKANEHVFTVIFGKQPLV